MPVLRVLLMPAGVLCSYRTTGVLKEHSAKRTRQRLGVAPCPEVSDGIVNHFRFRKPTRDKNIFIDFDGVYCNSEVWINGHYLGLRPNGYISFRYNLTPYLKFGSGKNEIAVKVDNSHQPNSRWYSGSGIFRNVWLVKTSNIHIDHWGSFITTPEISDRSATVNLKLQIRSAKGSGALVDISTSFWMNPVKKLPVPR